MTPSRVQTTSVPREQPVAFSQEQLRTLRVAIDQIIPASGDGFPSATEATVDLFIAEHLPYDADVAFCAGLQALDQAAGGSLADAPQERRVAALETTERDRAAFFTTLLRITYYGYYARPVVAHAIRTVLGYDYNDHPQPYGYRLPAFDPHDPLQKPASPRGHYVETAGVRRMRIP